MISRLGATRALSFENIANLEGLDELIVISFDIVYKELGDAIQLTSYSSVSISIELLRDWQTVNQSIHF